MLDNIEDAYDVIVVGGGIAGSIAAKFTAKEGLKTLLIEKFKTPRNKTCSGIQFKYLQKIMGEKVPRERLCNYQIKKVRMEMPDGKSFSGPFKCLNFMRKPFDDWLNQVAQDYGAKFQDECACADCWETDTGIKVRLEGPDGEAKDVTTKYLVDGSGGRSRIRKKLRPQDYDQKAAGNSINYYLDGTAALDPETLYQFWNLDFCDAMFAWVYSKTLDDGKDYWVVGTGCFDGRLKERQENFLQYVRDKFNLVGDVIHKEGFAPGIALNSKDTVWFGQDRLLVTGDAAGLVDPVRGVGMDAAALSGRFAARAVVSAIKDGKNAMGEYERFMERVKTLTLENQSRGVNTFETNEDLQQHLKSTMLKEGVGMMVQSFLNKFRSVENVRLLPP